jgi:transcriptional regulator with XRE-family HTH domain
MGKTLGDILRDFRKREGLTQEEVALAADLERTHVSMIERSIYMPTLKTFFAYCRGLSVAPSEVVAKIDDELGDPSTWPGTNPPNKSS